MAAAGDGLAGDVGAVGARPEPAPSVPTRLRGLDRDELVEVVARVRVAIKVDDVPTLAAGIAFKIFLALIPAMIAVVGVFSLVTDPGDVVDLVDAIEVLPPEISGLLIEPLQRIVASTGGASLALAFGIVAGLWSASSAAATLMRSLSRAFGVGESRGFVGQRITAVVICLALLAALAGLVLLLVAGAPLQRALLDLAPDEVGGPASVVLTLARQLAALVVLMLLFAFVYWIGPDRSARPRWEWITPGAVFGVVGWLVLTAGFNLYTRVADPEANAPIAGLGAVLVLLLWLQLSMAVLLIGGQLNAELRRVRATRAGEVSPSARAAVPATTSVAAPVAGRRRWASGTWSAAKAALALAAAVGGAALGRGALREASARSRPSRQGRSGGGGRRRPASRRRR